MRTRLRILSIANSRTSRPRIKNATRPTRLRGGQPACASFPRTKRKVLDSMRLSDYMQFEDRSQLWTLPFIFSHRSETSAATLPGRNGWALTALLPRNPPPLTPNPVFRFPDKSRRTLPDWYATVFQCLPCCLEDMHRNPSIASVLELHRGIPYLGDFFGGQQPHSVYQRQVRHRVIVLGSTRSQAV